MLKIPLTINKNGDMSDSENKCKCQAKDIFINIMSYQTIRTKI